jgi:hypothetical protein
MAKKSSGKKSCNRAAQKASASRHNEEAIKSVFEKKKDFIIGRVEAARGFAQFTVAIGKGINIQATPLGVFTQGSCPIHVGQVVLMEPTEKKDQVHQIVGRIDKKKDVTELIKMGVLSAEIFGEDKKDDIDIFDYTDELDVEIDEI